MKNRKLTVLLVLAVLICVFLTLPALAAEKAAEKKVNINTATVEELITLKGIGEKKAHAIIEYREAHGLFKSIDDLKNIKGIGEKIFDSIESDITIEE